MDKHTVALISIIGTSLDVLGALYLAYDLLGGEHGPLRKSAMRERQSTWRSSYRFWPNTRFLSAFRAAS